MQCNHLSRSQLKTSILIVVSPTKLHLLFHALTPRSPLDFRFKMTSASSMATKVSPTCSAIMAMIRLIFSSRGTKPAFSLARFFHPDSRRMILRDKNFRPRGSCSSPKQTWMRMELSHHRVLIPQWIQLTYRTTTLRYFISNHLSHVVWMRHH